MSIWMFLLKWGCNLHASQQPRRLGTPLGRTEAVPKLPERMAVECLVLLGDVHPETAFSADRAGALNDKPEHVVRVGRGWEVDVPSRHIGRAIILQRKQVNLTGRAHGAVRLYRRSDWAKPRASAFTTGIRDHQRGQGLQKTASGKERESMQKIESRAAKRRKQKVGRGGEVNFPPPLVPGDLASR